MKHLNRLAAAASSLIAITLVLWSAPALAAPDAWITANVKTALITSPDVHAGPINVDTNDGRVTLHGEVASTLERRVASQVASRVDGVRSVNNLLQIVPRDARKMVHVSDARLKTRVSNVFRNDPQLAHSGIHVASVNRGVVLLSGRARTSMQRLHALEVAARVPGVRRTASEVTTPNDRDLADDWDRHRNDRVNDDRRDRYGNRTAANDWNDDRRRADNDRSNVPDAWITASTKMKFATDGLVPATTINVDTDNGEVTLFGTVPSQASAQQAVRLARQVDGVRAVHNELVVVPRDDRRQATADDGRITARIKDRFDRANFRQANIHVDVRAGVARLTGTYDRDRDHYDALMLARSTPGVLYVQDDLEPDNDRASQE